MREKGLAVSVKEQPGYKELFSEMDDGLVERLWVRGQACEGDIMMGGYCTHPIRVSKLMEPSLKHWRKPLKHRP